MKQVYLKDIVIHPTERRHGIVRGIQGGIIGLIAGEIMDQKSKQAYADNLTEIRQRYLPAKSCDDAAAKVAELNDLKAKLVALGDKASAPQQRYIVSYTDVLETLNEYLTLNCVDHLTGQLIGSQAPAAPTVVSAPASTLDVIPPSAQASFITTYKTPLLVGGGLMLVLLVVYAIRK